MELVNQAYDVVALAESGRCGTEALKEAVESAVMLLAPFVPHVSEEMWQSLGKKSSIFRCPWPLYDTGLIVADVISIPVQINGKLRSKVDVPVDIQEAALKETVLADPKVRTWISYITHNWNKVATGVEQDLPLPMASGRWQITDWSRDGRFIGVEKSVNYWEYWVVQGLLEGGR